MLEKAMPVIGYNGVLDAFAEELRHLDNQGDNMDNLVHMVGQYAMELALRNHSGAAAAKASSGVLATAAYKTAYTSDLNSLWDSAPVHSGVWTAILAAKPASPESFWEVGTQLVAPVLNTIAFINAVHGVGHAAALHALNDAFDRGDCVSRVIRSSAKVTQSALHKSSQLCSGAPSHGLAHMCGGGLWMTLLTLPSSDSEAPFGVDAVQEAAAAKTASSGGVDASSSLSSAMRHARWLPMIRDGDGASAAKLDASCDVAPFPNFCFYFYSSFYDDNPKKNRRVSANECAERPMSRAHRLHCVFTVSSKSWAALLHGGLDEHADEARVSRFCRARPATAARPTDEISAASVSSSSALSDREHLVACLIGLQYENRGDPPLAKRACVDLAHDLPDDAELHELCHDAGNFCASPGACADPRAVLAKSGAWLHEHSA